MTRRGIRIEQGLPDALRAEAAALYWQAFGGKLGRVLGPEDLALRFLTRVMRADHCLTAIDADGHLVGLAGFKTRHGSFAGGSEADLRAIYGQIGGRWRGLLLRLLGNEGDNRRFLLDGLCVALVEEGIASNVTDIPNSALAGVDTTTTGAAKLPQLAVATYSFASQGGAIGTVSLGVNLPSGALVTSVTTEVVTAPTSAGGTGTIKLVLPTDGDLTATLTANGSATSLNTLDTTVPKKATAQRTLSATIATTALTAGVLKFYVFYVQSV